ncbi:small acid-soluble spore protein Tlp [Paenibacillus alvei]|uniref:Small acid-soluble spore protein Tlp n=1 Tax=Paenibacillus alvei TaxID=44250 RepID=A0ABT4GXM0_PAEAL|nr:small acid-soluble spore protein Tlp [Paenibacillus alvei]EJW19691.1 small, acid-soluble spore protein [Paenibacillus alvei DSM 29]MCY9540749.1 small acid-soluble spore protein Tlp [Paenibacillus alvei]MCY9702988.1 small acid-soluble spore protein Tlp [Paenibacillus alvei]MCY9734569.1 small acid-soluble spore protein Tlp [Paenibacillus alvei]MCY9757636.1 small acid-soluble spore protein Tlp [Paenibacillus alvei]
MAKPDDRSNNAARLQNAIDNTSSKLHKTEQYLTEHAEEISANERHALQAKNERRRHSIEGFAAEKRDEQSNASS